MIKKSELIVTKKKMVVYKKVYKHEKDWGRLPLIAMLEIPKRTACHMTNYKCRASRAKVLEIRTYSRTNWYPRMGYELKEHRKVAYSAFSKSFKYKVGEVVRPKRRFSRSLIVCASGIHFYRTIEEAVNH
jgi:hypothetical protein